MNATPVNATAFAAGFVIVNVSEVVAFSAMLDGLKTLAIDGGATTLMRGRSCSAGSAFSGSNVSGGVVLGPAAMPVTFTENVQELLGRQTFRRVRLIDVGACRAL